MDGGHRRRRSFGSSGDRFAPGRRRTGGSRVAWQGRRIRRARLTGLKASAFTMGTVARITAEAEPAEQAVAAVTAESRPSTAIFDRSGPTAISQPSTRAGGEWVEVPAR